MSEQNKQVPRLRFPGFTDAWVKHMVKDIFTVTRGNVLATTKTTSIPTDKSIFPVYSSQTKNDGLMGYYDKFLFQNAITWTTDGANAGTVKYRRGKFYSTNVNGVLLGDFANKATAEILNRIAYKIVSKVGNPKLMNNVMAEIEIFLPNFEEQQRISNLLDKLDNLITVNERELNKLKNLKKSYLEKMFPKNGSNIPELRFPGYTDAWVKYELSELAKFSKGRGYSKRDLVKAGYPIILYGRLYTNYETTISTVTDTFVSADLNSIKSEIGDVIVPGSGETAEDISRASTIDISGIILGGDLNIIKPDKQVLDSIFLAITISNGSQQRELTKRAQGKSVVHLHNSDLERILVYLPSKNEQTKIGNFFTKLDKVITVNERELKKLKELKKSYLNDMFV